MPRRAELKSLPFRQFMTRVRHVENISFELGLDEGELCVRVCVEPWLTFHKWHVDCIFCAASHVFV